MEKEKKKKIKVKTKKENFLKIDILENDTIELHVLFLHFSSIFHFILI